MDLLQYPFRCKHILRSAIHSVPKQCIKINLTAAMKASEQRICKLIKNNLTSAYITKAVKNHIDISFETFNVDWVGHLIFPVRQYSEENILSEIVPLEDRSITEYIHYQNRENFSIPNYYFCNIKYPTAGGFNGPGYDKLVKDLQMSSISNGY